MGLPMASNPGLVPPGNLSRNVFPVCPVKSWNAGNTDDCSFFSPRLFPFAEVVPGDGRPFLFGQLGGGGFPPAASVGPG